MGDESTESLQALKEFLERIRREDYAAAQALADSENDAEVRGVMSAMIAGAKGDYASVVSLLEKPDFLRNPWALRMLAFIDFHEKGEEGGRLRLSEAFRNGADKEDIQLIFAEYLQACGRYREANAVLGRLEIRSDPLAAIEMRLRTRDYETAEGEFNALPDAVRQSPSGALMKIRLDLLLGRIESALGGLFENKKLFDEAGLSLAASVIELTAKLRTGKTREAIEAMDNMGAPLPTLRLPALIQAGMLDAAAKFADSTLDDDMAGDDRLFMTKQLLAAKLFNEALKQIEAVPYIADKPMHDFDRRYLLAKCLRETGRVVEADKEYLSLARDLRACYIRDPRETGAYFMLAGCLRDMGKLSEAREAAAFLKKVYPRDKHVSALCASLT